MSNESKVDPMDKILSHRSRGKIEVNLDEAIQDPDMNEVVRLNLEVLLDIRDLLQGIKSDLWGLKDGPPDTHIEP